MNPGERRARVIRTRRQRSASHIFYDHADENEDEIAGRQAVSELRNVVQLRRSCEIGRLSYCRQLRELGSRRMVEESLFKENLLPLNANKVFCSQWLSDSEIIVGTKCNGIFVYDIKQGKFFRLREPKSSPDSVPPLCESGIHALDINPSRNLLVTGGPHSNDVAVYSLHDRQPVCVGERAHEDWIFDVKWLDDHFFISGARDGTLALWCVNSSEPEYVDSREYYYMKPLVVQLCQQANKVRALSFRPKKYLTALSSNSFLHKWDMTTFQQMSSHKLPFNSENVCLEYDECRNIFAVGSSAHVTFIDSRTYGMVKNIRTMCKGSSVRSMSFKDSLLTVGTGMGQINFFDLKAGRYLERGCNVTHVPGQMIQGVFSRIPWSFLEGMTSTAVYTHCYDQSGTRFFAGGGPLAVDMHGCYAALWQ